MWFIFGIISPLILIPLFFYLCQKNTSWRDKLKEGDSSVYPITVFLAISAGLSMNGLLASFCFDGERLVDWRELGWLSLYVGIVFTAGLLFSAFVFLGRWVVSYGFLLAQIAFLGLTGMTTTAFVVLHDLNRSLDRSAAVKYSAKVLQKEWSQGRSSTYYLYADPWKGEKGIQEMQKIKVPGRLFEEVGVGDNIIVTQRAGYLNYKWYADIRRE